MGFQEKDLENLINDILQNNGFEHVKGNQLDRNIEDVLLKGDLKAYLKNTYSKYNITDKEIDRIILSLEVISVSPLYEANKIIMRKITDGEIFKRDNKDDEDFLLTFIDYDNINNNIFKACNQVIIKGKKETRIIDEIIFVNGIPLVVDEFKSAIKKDVNIYDAYKQITKRYVRDIPELFKYNAFVVISDGVNTKMGSIFSDYEYFYPWNRVNMNDDEAEGLNSLMTMLNGLFTRERLCDFIHNFIYFPDDCIKNKGKIVGRCAQYFAVEKLYKNILVQSNFPGVGKGGLYFGTAGCGKSYTMVFLSRMLMHSKELTSPTILVIVDRTDLDDQLTDNYFINSKTFIGENDISSIETREDLKNKLLNKASGGIYITTIQKFTESLSLLSDRNNIIALSDEAHRSQNNLEEKIVISDNFVKTSYGYAAYLHKSFPNATYVGFTSTPTDEAIETFGSIIDRYTMEDAISDGVIVKLIYDGRFVPVVINEENLKKIEKYYFDAIKNGANRYQVEEIKKALVDIETIMENPKILEIIVDNFIEDYERKVFEKTIIGEKAFFRVQNRKIAYEIYKLIKQKRPEWVKEILPSINGLSIEEYKKLKPMPKVKMIMTRDKDDDEELYNLLGTDEDRREDAVQYKNINSSFKIAILVDMWSTGFDVPFLNVSYNYKLFSQEHNVYQWAWRIGRSYPGKDYGVIVDFIGIKEILDKSFKKYSKFEESTVEGIEKSKDIVKEQLLILDTIMKDFDNSKYFNGTEYEKFNCLNESVEYVKTLNVRENQFMESTKRLSKAFNICNCKENFSKEDIDKINYYKAVRSIIFKFVKTKAPDLIEINEDVQKMINGAIEASDIECLFEDTKDFDSNKIELLSEENLKKISQIKFPNIKLNAMQYLLSNQISDMNNYNKIKAKSFSEKFRDIVDKYNDKRIEHYGNVNLLSSVEEEFNNLANEIIEENKTFNNLNIDYEEKAFLDIFVEIEKEYNISLTEEENLKFVNEVNNIIKIETKNPNWMNRNDIKSKIKVDIIKMLSKNHFPSSNNVGKIPENYLKIVDNIIEQAIAFKDYYNE